MIGAACLLLRLQWPQMWPGRNCRLSVGCCCRVVYGPIYCAFGIFVSPRRLILHSMYQQWGGHVVGLIAAASYLIGLLIAMGLLSRVASFYLSDFLPSVPLLVAGAHYLVGISGFEYVWHGALRSWSTNLDRLHRISPDCNHDNLFSEC